MILQISGTVMWWKEQEILGHIVLILCLVCLYSLYKSNLHEPPSHW